MLEGDNTLLVIKVARNNARKHYRQEYAAHEDYQFSVFMLILAQVHHAITKARIERGLSGEMKHCSTIIRQQMTEAGFVFTELE